MSVRWLVSFLASGIVLGASPATGQTDRTRPLPPPVPFFVDSGPLDNPHDEPRSVYDEHLSVPGASWLRLYFGDSVLGPGSVLRIASTLDDAVQELDAARLRDWRNTSAYFNGDTVRLQLVAGARSLGNRLVVEQVAYHEPQIPFTVCEPDTRVPSDEPAAGRIEPIGCSGMVWGGHGCVMSAGHCMDVPSQAQVIEFRVPPNHPVTCANQHPPVEDQFPLTAHVFEDGGSGDDWGIAKTLKNSVGETVLQRYGATFRRTALVIPRVGETVTIWGYGADDECLTDGAEQRSDGQVTLVAPTYVAYDADTTGGSSGSGVTHDGEIIAVHAHGGCPQNDGARVDVPDFALARADLCIREKGSVAFSRTTYACNDAPVVRVEDSSLIGAGPQGVSVGSDSETEAESVILSEAYAAVFGGSATTAGIPAVPGDGVVSVAHGDTLTATYQDADIGNGSPGVDVATAAIDCLGPIVADVQVGAIDETAAVVTWTTDEPATSRVTVEGPEGTLSYSGPDTVTQHSVDVVGLMPCTTYLFSVTSVDVVGNVTVEDNAGALYPFDTLCPAPPPVPDGLVGHGIVVGLPSATEIQVAWDNDCVATGPTKLIHGPLAGVANYEVAGALCDIPATAGAATWAFPPGDQWFVLVKENGIGIEGSWGQSTAGERNGTTPSGQCDVAGKEVAGACP